MRVDTGCRPFGNAFFLWNRDPSALIWQIIARLRRVKVRLRSVILLSSVSKGKPLAPSFLQTLNARILSVSSLEVRTTIHPPLGPATPLLRRMATNVQMDTLVGSTFLQHTRLD